MNFNGFTFISKNRSDGKGGGVAFYINEHINFKRRENLETPHIESLWIEILIKNSKSILVGCFYRPPESSKYLPNDYNEKFYDQLSKAISENKETILLGDFNINYRERNNNNDFKTSMKLFGFKQIVTQATRITKDTSTIIDLIFTNKEYNISDCNVVSTSTSDHEMTTCIRKINNAKHNPKTIKCRDYANYDPEQLII